MLINGIRRDEENEKFKLFEALELENALTPFTFGGRVGDGGFLPQFPIQIKRSKWKKRQ